MKHLPASSAIVSITGQNRATCRFWPSGGLWSCQYCWQLTPRPITAHCPKEERTIMQATFGLNEFLRALGEPGNLTLGVRGTDPRSKTALAWKPVDIPHSWAPAIWRPSRVWLHQPVREMYPTALLAEMMPGHALRFTLPGGLLVPCRERGRSYRYEIPLPQVTTVSTTEIKHRRPGGEVT